MNVHHLKQRISRFLLFIFLLGTLFNCRSTPDTAAGVKIVELGELYRASDSNPLWIPPFDAKGELVHMRSISCLLFILILQKTGE